MKKLNKKEIIELQTLIKRLNVNVDIPINVYNAILSCTVLAYRETKRQGETEALRGTKPPYWPGILNTDDTFINVSDMKVISKAWADSKTKDVGIDFGKILIFGTGGEESPNSDYFRKMWERDDKSITMDLFLLFKNQYKAKDGTFKKATICIDGNFYALKSDIYETKIDKLNEKAEELLADLRIKGDLMLCPECQEVTCECKEDTLFKKWVIDEFRHGKGMHYYYRNGIGYRRKQLKMLFDDLKNKTIKRK